MKNNKVELRREMQKKRNMLTLDEVNSLSEKIAVRIIESVLYKECKHICIYQAFRNEVSCEGIMKKAWLDKKRVYVPVTDKEQKRMDFFQIREQTQWRVGSYNIMEPVLDTDTIKLQEPALILMPGLAFDKNKRRIGYGGGYYDKYLEQHQGHITAALCYQFQIVKEELPHEEYDILPDYIVTENEIF